MAVTVAAPLDWLGQAFVIDPIVADGLGDVPTVAVAVALHPFPEVTVTVYAPAASPVAVAVFWLLLQW